MATLWHKLKSVSIEVQTTIHMRLPVCQLQTEEPLENARGKIYPAFKTKESPFLWMERPWDFWEIGSHVYPQDTDEVTQEILTDSILRSSSREFSNTILFQFVFIIYGRILSWPLRAWWVTNVMVSSNRQIIVCCAGREWESVFAAHMCDSFAMQEYGKHPTSTTEPYWTGVFV